MGYSTFFLSLLLKSLFWRTFPTHPFKLFLSSCCHGTSRKETQVHKMCLSHILPLLCSHEEWNGNQGLKKLHGGQCRSSSDGASLWKTCVQEMLEERKGWRAEEEVKILENAENFLYFSPYCHSPAYHRSTRPYLHFPSPSTSEEMVNSLELCCERAVQCS